VRQGKYREALTHYSHAQYVLPQQDKSPLLFYNMGLCFARWGRPHTASEFLRIALIKQPEFKKAQQLLSRLESKAIAHSEMVEMQQ
jgi:Tfp pilus assembly protein PilF